MLILLLSIAGAIFGLFLCAAMVWRLGTSLVSPAQSLIEDEGLKIGAPAPEIAGYDATDGSDAHLSFGGVSTFVVFGSPDCPPCKHTVVAAQRHPALRYARLVFVGGGREDTRRITDELPRWVSDRWEEYRFHDERSARQRWRAPVSPYFHLVGHDGRVLAKGVATADGHLDRLLPVLHSTAAGRSG